MLQHLPCIQEPYQPNNSQGNVNANVKCDLFSHGKSSSKHIYRLLPTASEGWGKVMFSVCSHPGRGGGTYLGQAEPTLTRGGCLPWPGRDTYLGWGGGVPTLARGVHTLARGYLPWLGGYLPWPGGYLL